MRAATTKVAASAVQWMMRDGLPMTQLQGVILTAGSRGFVVSIAGEAALYPPKHARLAQWYSELPADDQQTVTAWLTIWARQARGRRGQELRAENTGCIAELQARP